MSDGFPLAPIHDEYSRTFYEAAGEGRLIVQQCSACQRFQFYPRRRCATCHSDDVAWVEVSGHGVVHTFTVIHVTANEEFASDCPYVFAIIELDEGVRLASRVVGVAPSEVRCELPVRVEFERRGDLTMPWFTAGDR